MKWSKRFNHSGVQFIHTMFFGVEPSNIYQIWKAGVMEQRSYFWIKTTTQKWLSAISLVWNRITRNGFLSKVITKSLVLFMCSFDLNSSLNGVIFFIVCYYITKEVFLHSLPKRWLVQDNEAPRSSSKSLASQERSETRYLHENQCTDGAHPVRSSLGNQDYYK